MRKKIEWSWEQIDEGTWRAKVIGGWLVLHVKTFAINGSKNYNMAQSESLAFVADRDHEWTIVAPMVEENKNPTNKVNDFSPK
jgi:hypothetical protein